MKFKLLLFAMLFSVMGWGQIYQHDFGTTAITVKPYTGVPTIFDANLSGSSWTTSANDFAGLVGNGGAPSQSLSLTNSSGTPTLTLTFNVAAGYQLSVTQFNFWRQRSNSGAQNWSMTINGIAVGSGTVPTTGAAIGNTNVSNAVSNLTGTITIVLKLSGASGTGTFRLDDFTLNGTVTPIGPLLSATTLNSFGNLCVGGTYGPNSFTLSGSLLNAGDLTIGALPGYTYSTTASGTYTSTLTLPQSGGAYSQTIYVKFNPIAAVSYNGNIPISGGGASSINVAASGTGLDPVTPGVSIAAVPSGAICAGTSVTFTATPSNLGGGTASYQWKVNGINVGTGSTYTSSTFANGDVVTCVLTVTGGCVTTATATSAGTTMTVNPIPADPIGLITISANPSCGPATLSYPAGYYWQTTAGGTSLANPTSSNYTLNATGTVYVRAYNGSCWSAGSINSGPITINIPVNITTHPTNKTISDGTTTTFAVTATGTGLTYQWQVDTGSGFTNLANGAPYSGVTAPTMTITGATLAMSGYLYRCIVSGAAPCGSVTSNSGSLTVNYTAPNNPTAIVPCYGNTTLGLSWTASSGTAPAPDGYMVFALAGATAPAATSAVAGNANLYTANSDFSLATVVTASLGKCVYKGTGTSVTVTGLTNLSNYSFKVVAYRGNTGTAWSSGITATPTGTWATPTTNITIDMPEVSSLAASVASGQSALTWNRPTPLACYDQYLVVANQGAVVFTPSGDGSAYTANTVYSGPNQVVYNGTGTGVTVTGLTNGTNYCYKVFVRRGTEWSDGVSVCQTPNIVYCEPIYSTGCSSSDRITNFVLESISNNTGTTCSTTPKGYSDYTSLSTNLATGVTYSGTLSTGSGGASKVAIWIDFNDNGTFEASEMVYFSPGTFASSSTNTISLTIPPTAPLGSHRMRVRLVFATSGSGSSVDPCTSESWGEVEDYTVNVLASCVPTHTVTSFSPASGPVGTEVTINGTGLTGTTVSFAGVNATIVSNTGTQMVVVIPAGATTGMLSVSDAQPCAIDNPFTIITKDITSCEGAATTDLIIYELHDEKVGDGGFITLYNGTAATINLSNYSIYRAGDYGGAMSNYATLTGSIAPGALGVVTVDAASCRTATNGDLTAGFNENDQIQLRNAAGTVVIDDVQAYIPAPGYYMVRKPGALNARTTYVAADWDTTPLIANQCIPSAGLVPPSSGVPPTVTLNPVNVSTSCSSISATLTVAGTEGFAGGKSLAYQWYYVAPGSSSWAVVNDGGVYSGATTTTLNISNTTSLDGFQYYCQIREDLNTCYSATNAVKISGGSATTWNGSGWSNGTPTLSKAAIINGNYNTTTNGNIDACSLTVNAGFTATVTAGRYFNIQNEVTVATGGVLTVEHNGSLVQINNAAVNSGNINLQRTTPVDRLDYVYWSAPVVGFNTNNISLTSNNATIYQWEPTVAGNVNAHGTWVSAANKAMTAGRGYIESGLNSAATDTPFTATFTGVPHNGIITPAISRGAYDTAADYYTVLSPTYATKDDDNWNLLGNPYPSSVSLYDFLSVNTNIAGFINVWKHGLPPTQANPDPFYNDYGANYNANDYETHNLSGSSAGPAAPYFIPSGQGFMVLMNANTAATNETVTFNNAMRSKGYRNDQFLRTSNNLKGSNSPEGRIWLDIVSGTTSRRAMVGYINGASYEKDRLFDAITDLTADMNLYSLVGYEGQIIQGRQTPFDQYDKVPLGIKVPQNGTYTIAIGEVEGLFTNAGQNIFLEDKALGIIHNLRQAPYQFTQNAGIINDRFILRYTDQALDNDEFENIAAGVKIYGSDHSIVIDSKANAIQSYDIYNVLGQLLASKKQVKGYQAEEATIMKNNQALIVKVTLENGQVVSKKIMY